MHSPTKALVQDLKREVLAELQPEIYAQVSTQAHYNPDRSSSGIPLYSSTGPAAYPTYQLIKDSVKNEVLAQIEQQQTDQLAKAYGLDRALSDQRIQQLVDRRYRDIDRLKADLRKELQALQRLEEQRPADPYIRQIAQAVAQEARLQGLPLQQVAQSLGRKPGAGISSWLSDTLNFGQRKGFLCGVGACLLTYLLWPGARNSLHSAAVRSMEEGMAMVNRAKSFVGATPPPTSVPNPPDAGITDANPPTTTN
ncbi:MAG: hypothetical protein GX952_00755 [Firmicutes bacterium]|nr:hypothetical protein [Bacillota bacterium]